MLEIKVYFLIQRPFIDLFRKRAYSWGISELNRTDKIARDPLLICSRRCLLRKNGKKQPL